MATICAHCRLEIREDEPTATYWDTVSAGRDLAGRMRKRSVRLTVHAQDCRAYRAKVRQAEDERAVVEYLRNNPPGLTTPEFWAGLEAHIDAKVAEILAGVPERFRDDFAR